ncbi:MAG TPA: LysM domain-containing protein [Chthoniobacterales bacterium]|jgi:LysM repeat protein|nr:LysM domain-containing protein [Chthoniobacterales bacterium]
MKLLRLKRLRATTIGRPPRAAAQANYDDLSEPNMKLSRALLVVLLLHVVAVSGIIAFNAIKTRQTAAIPPAVSQNTTPVAPLPSAPASSSVASKTDHAKKTESFKSAIDLHKIYVVAKGDNPVTIAKKFKVSYDDLITLNHIDDPRKLRVGQKLLIPAKTTKAKKTTE